MNCMFPEQKRLESKYNGQTRIQQRDDMIFNNLPVTGIIGSIQNLQNVRQGLSILFSSGYEQEIHSCF